MIISREWIIIILITLPFGMFEILHSKKFKMWSNLFSCLGTTLL